MTVRALIYGILIFTNFYDILLCSGFFVMVYFPCPEQSKILENMENLHLVFIH